MFSAHVICVFERWARMSNAKSSSAAGPYVEGSVYPPSFPTWTRRAGRTQFHFITHNTKLLNAHKLTKSYTQHLRRRAQSVQPKTLLKHLQINKQMPKTRETRERCVVRAIRPTSSVHTPSSRTLPHHPPRPMHTNAPCFTPSFPPSHHRPLLPTLAHTPAYHTRPPKTLVASRRHVSRSWATPAGCC